MSKLIVKTSGEHMLVLPSGEPVLSSRPYVVPNITFVSIHLANKNLTLLAADVPDEATDEEFLTYWLDCERDERLTVASFLSKFMQPAQTTPKEDDAS